MSAVDVSFRIGGMAGQGVESSGAGFIQALARGGLQAIGVADYYSRIRGGHNYFTIRVADRPVYAVKDSIELLLAFNEEAVVRHVDKLVPGGIVIVDEETEIDPGLVEGRDVRIVRSPLTKIAQENGVRLARNTAALAVAAALVGFDVRHMLGVIESNFGVKGDRVVQMNRRIAESAYAWTVEHAGRSSPWKVRAREAPRRVTINGNQAFAMGSIAAGCKFVAGYPMTPATSILEYAAQHAAQWGLVVKHAEGEIAAVNMCIGAAHAGVRAMTPTSGGGFDLMTEGLSLAGITETPLVVCLAQRPGPATICTSLCTLPTASFRASFWPLISRMKLSTVRCEHSTSPRGISVW
jgi:2-oxoglutarate ferredoxin oxidoreductase subunit alpha